MEKVKKTFVMDTNVILHDSRSIYSFDEHDIVIPITVLEELDQFKKGSDIINYQAREFMRELDKISGDNFYSEGISLGEGKGMLYIETGKEFSKVLRDSFSENVPDHKILAVADYINKQRKNVVFVSKDINLRMKAKAIGILAQDYETDKIRNLDQIHKKADTFTNINDDLINRLYKETAPIPAIEFGFDKLETNQYFILKGDNTSALARYNGIEKTIGRVEKQRAYGIAPRNAEQSFALDALFRPDIQLVALTGKAGTGKTLIALAAALAQRHEYHQIFLARPIVPLSNRDLGFLPGDVKDKIGPYMQPLFDNLSVIKHCFSETSTDYKRIDEMLKSEKLVITPLAYIRGRSLSKVFFIVDEAQNLTPHEIKTIITRAGEGTKMIFTGDVDQIDSPYLDSKSNGLSHLTHKMRGQSVFSHIHLMRGERSNLADLASNLL